MQAKIYNGGVPYAPDLKRLTDAFGVPEPGTLVTYEEMRAALDREVEESRFRGLVAAWRNSLEREHNVLFDAVPNVGLQALDGTGRVRHVQSKFRRGARAIRKATIRAAATDRGSLSTEEAQHLNKLEQLGTKTLMAMRVDAEIKNLIPALPVTTPRNAVVAGQ